ncbi:hypothetical protein AAFN60_18990 [Roseibacillus persicicus]|uniref:hypothetical protein n=1 Tax=Roseibacillus persicicus TaxID=454148 RepID=UPI00398AA64E
MAKILDHNEEQFSEPANLTSEYRPNPLSVDELKNKVREKIALQSEMNPSDSNIIESYQELLELLDANPHQARLLLEISEEKEKTRQ